MTWFTSPHPPIDVDACRKSCAALLLEKDAKFPDDMPAYIDGVTGEVVSRAAHRARVLSIASSLRNLESVGLKPLHKGSTAIVFCQNSVLYPAIMMALSAAGIRAAYANSSYKEFELAHAYKLSGATHILVHPDLLSIAVRTLGSLGIQEREAKSVVVLSSFARDTPADLTKAGWVCIDQLRPHEGLKLPEGFEGSDADEVATIYFSSGTTGMNKAVGLSHLNVSVSIVQAAAAWEYFKYQDVVLGVLPFYHIYGASTVVLLSLYLGAPIVILPRFSPEQCLSAIQRFKVNAAIIAPPLLTFFATDPRVDNYDLSSLRVISTGAAPVLPAMYDHCHERFTKRGINVNFSNAYGLTEITGLITWLPSEHTLRLKGSVGALLSNTEGRIVDEKGRDVPPGQSGELWLRGPGLMKGYVGNPQATAEIITSDGWLRTGDIAVYDSEGFLTIVDRRKELIKYKGFQVAPAEMESILSGHPAVADSAVIGIFSEKEGTEVPRAYVVPKDIEVLRRNDSKAFTEEMNNWLKDRVAHYKLLRGGVVLVDTVPRSAAGKILRKELRQLIQAELQAKAKL